MTMLLNEPAVFEMPPREAPRYGLLEQANKAPADWRDGVLICKDGCDQAYVFHPACDKFISWQPNPGGAGPLDMEFTANGPRAATATWDFGDGSTPPTTAAAVVTHTFAAPGVYYITAYIPETAAGACDDRSQIWPIQVGDPACAGCSEFDPFIVFADVVNDGPNYDIERLLRLARNELDSTLSAALERAAWAGAGIIGQPQLADANLNVINDAAASGVQSVSPAAGLAGIEQALASGDNVIHMSLKAATLLWRDQLLVKEGDSLYTAVGHSKVIAGTGYPVKNGPNPYMLPDGSTQSTDSVLVDTFEWMIGHSGPAWLWVGDVDVYETPEPSRNRMTARAQVPAMVAWDGCAQYGAVIDASC